MLLLLCVAHWLWLRKKRLRFYAVAGWLTVAVALISPLCALSVSLFSARVGQHMLLVLAAAPLIGLAIPRRQPGGSLLALWASVTSFFVALWLWHMPLPYEATFTSTSIYWSMHLTLFASAVWVWRELLQHPAERTLTAFAAGALTSVQMGFLGAVLTFAGRPFFKPHLLTTYAWGLSPLEDQQLGGVFMWVPGIALFLWVAIRSMSVVVAIGKPRPA